MDFDLRQEVERVYKGYESTWKFDGRDFDKPSSEEVLRNLINQSESGHTQRLHAEFFGYGPLETLLNCKGLQEIIVLGAREIWIEQDGELRKHGDCFHSERTFQAFVERVCTEAEIKVDLAQPFADGRWREFRVHVGRAPLTHCSFHLNFRRFPENPWSLDSLGEAGWASAPQIAKLKELVHLRKNLIFLGPTGSGKTTVLGACLAELEPAERTVIIEDTDELRRPNSVSSKLLSRTHAGPGICEVTLSELVKQSLRMRPSRLVMGEVRGEEAKDLLLALATGHGGSMSTLHAADARQALLRMEMLVQLGAPQWSVQTVRQLMHLSIDALVVCQNERGHRRLGGVYKVAALESFGFLLELIV